jgi:hypothetical protein
MLTDGQIDRLAGGQTDTPTDGQTDSWMNEYLYLPEIQIPNVHLVAMLQLSYPISSVYM